MEPRTSIRVAALLLLAFGFAAGGCASTPPPVVPEGTTVSFEGVHISEGADTALAREFAARLDTKVIRLLREGGVIRLVSSAGRVQAEYSMSIYLTRVDQAVARDDVSPDVFDMYRCHANAAIIFTPRNPVAKAVVRALPYPELTGNIHALREAGRRAPVRRSGDSELVDTHAGVVALELVMDLGLATAERVNAMEPTSVTSDEP